MTVNGRPLTIRHYAVASLPADPGLEPIAYLVSDGASASDCSAGGGSHRHFCVWNGSAWAAASLTGAEIKALYEAEADTNEFSDAEQTKLAGIETSADVTDAANVRTAGAVLETSGNLSSKAVPVSDASGDLADSIITDDGTNVGVGESTPSQRLHVSAAAWPVVKVEALTTGGGILWLVEPAASWQIYSAGGALNFFELGGNVRQLLEAGGGLAYRTLAADPSTRANYAHVYAKDVSARAEIFVQDEAGNVTQVSPHDPETGEWVFYSENVKTGRRVRVDMERMVRSVEALTGEQYMRVEGDDQ